jgi:hypothetical protein
MTGSRRSRPCFYGCKSPARLYAIGPRCEEHAPPRQPTPPPGTTLAEIRAEHEKRKEVTSMPKNPEICDSCGGVIRLTGECRCSD